MSNSDPIEDSRLHKLMREYSDQPSPANGQNFQPIQQAQTYNPAEMFLSNDHRNNSDVRSLIENLMKTKEFRANTDLAYSPGRPVLVKAQEKIFNEVVNLLIEINDIKDSISKEKEATLQLEAERDHLLNKSSGKSKGGKRLADFEMDSIINKLKSREGDQFRISMTQLQKIAAQNEHLEQNINRLKIKNNGNAKELLQREKQRYQELRMKLEEKKADLDYDAVSQNDNQDFMSQIQKVERDIERLKKGDNSQLAIENQIQYLSQENQKLREKTIMILQSNDDGEDSQERRRLEDYIRQEEENKYLFLQDLKRFKAEYDELMRQNIQLKKRMGRDPVILMQGRSSEDKFHQYEGLVSEMHNVMR